jgi:hypothetical protein
VNSKEITCGIQKQMSGYGGIRKKERKIKLSADGTKI